VTRGPRLRAALFAGGALFSLTPYATPALALAAGLGLALLFGNPAPRFTERAALRLLQASVVGLGFGVSLDALATTGLRGAGYTAGLILGVLALALPLGRWLGVERRCSILIAAGTGICGGSAIAAMGVAIGAGVEAMSVSLATVFVLNAVALYLFPPLGHLLHLSQHQFALWSALAIHDTSSVIGAAASYGTPALLEATVLKLARALWIVPLALGAGIMTRRRAPDGARWPVGIPWFIALFVAAALARSLAPAGLVAALDGAAGLARTLLVLTLFLVGAQLTRATLAAVGPRTLAQGVILWVAVAGTTLLAITRWG
jgi:uncharacterized integral membrane protein (TIGR00698 family)